MEIFIILVFILGFLVSILASVAGIGGGAFYTPILHFIVGLNIVNALAVASIGIFIGSFLSSIIYMRRGVADIGIALPILAGEIITSSIATYLTRYLRREIFYVILSGVLLYNSIRLLSNRGRADKDLKRKPNFLELFLLGLFTGFIAPLAGIGGGVIVVPTLITLYGVESKVATASSLLIIAFNYFIVTSIHIYLGNLIYVYGISLATGIIFGSLIGTKLHKISKPFHIRLIIGLIALFFGIYTIYRLYLSLIS